MKKNKNLQSEDEDSFNPKWIISLGALLSNSRNHWKVCSIFRLTTLFHSGYWWCPGPNWESFFSIRKLEHVFQLLGEDTVCHAAGDTDCVVSGNMVFFCCCCLLKQYVIQMGEKIFQDVLTWECPHQVAVMSLWFSEYFMPVTGENQIDNGMKGTLCMLWAQGFVGSRIIWTLVLLLLWSIFWKGGLLFSLTSVMNLQPFVFLAFIKVIPNYTYYKCWNYLFLHFLNEMM